LARLNRSEQFLFGGFPRRSFAAFELFCDGNFMNGSGSLAFWAKLQTESIMGILAARLYGCGISNALTLCAVAAGNQANTIVIIINPPAVRFHRENRKPIE
jgi:hypothetical protein